MRHTFANTIPGLGTKAQIPCLASDPIKVFKAMVAARIGRAPHEIMLKRQGERPMKDALTLEDYGVSITCSPVFRSLANRSVRCHTAYSSTWNWILETKRPSNIATWQHLM
jgi:hypothetical protein